MGEYPISGDGFMAETVNSTDVTENQAVSVNCTDFRDGSGNFKMRIMAVKATSVQFEFRVDLVELEATTSGMYLLCIYGDFLVDLSSYPLSSIRGFEISMRYNSSEDGASWFLKAYNWTALNFSNSGFNNTNGNQPALNQWNEYTINITGNWRSYVKNDGTLLIQFIDEGLNTNQTIAGIDFFGVRAILDGISFDLKNTGSGTVQVVSIWIIDSVNHRRYDADLYINSGEESNYLRADITLPYNGFIAKVITERGKIAVFSSN